MANAAHAGFLARTELRPTKACPPRRSARGSGPTPKPPTGGDQGGPPKGFIRAAIIAAIVFVIALVAWPKHDDTKNGPAPPRDDESPANAAHAGVPPMGFQPSHGIASVRGTVTETNGAPLATATVCARQMADATGEDSTMTPRCTMVGVDGKYALVDLPAGRWMFSASAPGHMPAVHSFADGTDETRLVPNDDRSSIDLSLSLGGARIEGRVVDERGAAVPGATVTFTAHYADLVVTTDEQGAFVGDVALGMIGIAAEHAGFADAVTEAVAPTTLQIVMTRETILAGRVIDAATQLPVAGARVRPDGAEDVSWASNAESALTDADGRFRIEGLTPGRYRPFAEAIGAKGRVAESFVLGAGETAEDLVIAVGPARRVQGQVLLDGKKACREGWVSLTDPTSMDSADWRRIDENGAVLFPAVDDGKYEVGVECEGATLTVKTPLVVDRDLDGLSWTIARGLAIRGVVVDADGKPVAGVSLHASARDDSTDGDTSSGYAYTASDGSFSMVGLRAATYELTADGPMNAGPKEPIVVATTAGRDLEGVRIVMLRGGVVEGVVVDPAGAPVAFARVQSGGGGGTRFATTDAQGKFRLTGLSPGGTWLMVTSDRGRQLLSPKSETDLDVQDGKTITTRLVVKRADGFIRGRVVDAEGKPVAGAYVDADRNEYSLRLTTLSSETSVITDANGVFVITGLDDGPQVVRARSGANEATMTAVALGADVTLKIAGGAQLEGTVAFVDGRAPARFSVTLSAGYASLREDFVGTNGRFVFRSVPPGEATVTINATQGQGVATTTLTAGSASTVAVVISAFRTVSGRVVDESGRPVPNVEVSIEASSGYATTDARGEFSIERVFGEKLELEVYGQQPPYLHQHVSQKMDASSNAPIALGDVVLKPEAPMPTMPEPITGTIDGVEPPPNAPDEQLKNGPPIVDPVPEDEDEPGEAKIGPNKQLLDE